MLYLALKLLQPSIFHFERSKYQKKDEEKPSLTGETTHFYFLFYLFKVQGLRGNVDTDQ
jgi:hypothetical protein